MNTTQSPTKKRDAVTVRIPTSFRKLTKNKAVLEARPGPVRGIIDELQERHPGIREKICDQNGSLLGFVNVYVNEEDIRFMDNLNTVAEINDEISIIPAIAGG